MSDLEKLRAFARDILEGWPDVPQWDGLDLQEIAEKHGLLEPTTVTEACGEDCACSEYDDFPMVCYRFSKLLKGDTSAAETPAALICSACGADRYKEIGCNGGRLDCPIRGTAQNREGAL